LALRTTRPLLAAAALLLAGTLVVAAAEITLAAAPPPAPWPAYIIPANAVLYVVVGLGAWLRRPSSRLGFLLVAGGGCWLIMGLGNMGNAHLARAQLVTATLILAVILHLLLSFPTGRLRERADRAIVAAGYFVCLVLQAPLYLWHTGLNLQRAVGALVVLAAAWRCARRVRDSTPAQRRVLVPLTAYGIFALLVIPVSSALNQVWGGHVVAEAATQFLALSFVPLAFVFAASRGGFARTADLGELAAWLGADTAERPDLEAALAATLGDPSLRLRFRLAHSTALVDASGAEVAVPGSGRGVVDVVDGRGEPIAAIVYDATLLDRPDEVREAGRVVALAVDRERLTVSLRASRARIASAADDERRRIARDLHDGLQARLVLLAIQAGRGTEPHALRDGIQTAIDELRELVDGVMPTPLTERGLPAAVKDLADRLPAPIELSISGLDARLAPPVETAAWFVVSEAITNAVKHAGPDGLAVALERVDGTLRVAVTDQGSSREGEAINNGRAGSGVRGMADRVAAVGGALTILPAGGGGTRVEAVIPCGS
jgi:signal transduction histidine kinase